MAKIVKPDGTTKTIRLLKNKLIAGEPFGPDYPQDTVEVDTYLADILIGQQSAVEATAATAVIPPAEPALSKLNKAQLTEKAVALGLTVAEDQTNKQIIELIEAEAARLEAEVQ
jgi:hypothetical protein